MAANEETAREIAKLYYDQYLALVEVGFTEKQATVIMSRPQVTVNSSPYPPEVMEFWERQNALATKLLVDMDD
jgi:hypothetical protein